jgi:hypothetical protein
MKFKQLKDLPFTEAGAIWDVDKEGIIINGANYFLIDWAKSLVDYFTNEAGVFNPVGEWFEMAGSEEEKKEQIREQKLQLIAQKEYYQGEIEKVNESLLELEKGCDWCGEKEGHICGDCGDTFEKKKGSNQCLCETCQENEDYLLAKA